jgi:hypothetical protein
VGHSQIIMHGTQLQAYPTAQWQAAHIYAVPKHPPTPSCPALQAAETSRGLTRLSLHSNQIGAAGCAALAQAVARSPALVALDFLPGNLASEADVKVLGRALKAKLK